MLLFRAPRRPLTILVAFLLSFFTAATRPAPAEPLPGGSLDPTTIPKYQQPLVIPPAMPRTVLPRRGQEKVDYYEIALRQFSQQVLPPGFPATTVWGYGSLAAPGTVAEGGSFHAPSFTIEARWGRPVRVRWINDLVDESGAPLPHLLPVDQTLHWANPPGECAHGPSRPDCEGTSQAPYTGPVPMVVHLHGGESPQESDGFPEAWTVPDTPLPPFVKFATGTFYERFRASSPLGALWEPGTMVFQYPNRQRATTLWYHDHVLGMTRLNVYTGPAGFYLLRGGPDDEVAGRLPGPAPALHDPPTQIYHEIPIAIQDRSFDADGSLFYPRDRAFFEGLDPAQLQIPFRLDPAIGGASDVAPIWNPEFFGNTIIANGRTWPYLEVEQRRYRFRLLNGSQSRFLVLRLENGGTFWQIGADGGFLPAPAPQSELLLGPAERADVLVDFGDEAPGTRIRLLNLGPDEPFGEEEPDPDAAPADPDTTGQVMQFRVVERRRGPDRTTPPEQLVLPARTPLGPASVVRPLALVEQDSKTVFVSEDAAGNVVLDPGGEPFGPTLALLGTVGDDGEPIPKLWIDPFTENPALGATEVWELHNFTADAHPIHIHLVQFEVVERESMETGELRGPGPGETGTKDTVIAFPGEITRVKARFDVPGLSVWHCHILEHEDNEMMRPYCVGDCDD
ncbi:MAG TPA: multicopper oxidase [Myxococcota bacterium]|nr:multicopper oxidase [Myxococcota bacterium]